MISEEINQLVRNCAATFLVPQELIKAIALKESGWITWRTRFEPRWSYFYKPELFASTLGITVETEKINQATSFGLMQIMCGSARELGFDGHATQLCDPEIGLFYGTKKLNELMKKYSHMTDVIAAYNQGDNRRLGEPGFPYANQAYVDSVLKNVDYYKQDAFRPD